MMYALHQMAVRYLSLISVRRLHDVTSHVPIPLSIPDHLTIITVEYIIALQQICYNSYTVEETPYAYRFDVPRN